MSGVDLSVVVTTHAENYLLRPTLRAIAAALEAVTSAGYSSELVLVADNPTDVVLAELERWTNDERFTVFIHRVSFGEPGASRNAGIAASHGRFVALCDGDDLFTEDMLISAVRIMEERGPRVVVHPEYVLSFGDRTLLWSIRSTDDPSLTYRDLLHANLWPSCSIAPRELYLEFPYPELPPGSGYGPEDYFWNIQTASAGIAHVTAPGSLHLYRTRAEGGVNNANTTTVLPAFDLDLLRRGFPTPAYPTGDGRIRVTHRVRRLARRVYDLAKPMTSGIARIMPFPLRRRVYLRLRALNRRVFGGAYPPLAHMPSDMVERVRRVAQIEPAVSWSVFKLDEVPPWRPETDGYVEILEFLWDTLRDHSGVLMLAPWVGIGGADMVTLNYARDFAKEPALQHEVALLTTSAAERTHSYLIPPEVRHQQIPIEWHSLSPERQRRLLAQFIVLVRPKLILSINCFDFTNTLRSYGAQVCETSDVYLSLFAFDRIGKGSFPTNPITDDPRREYIGSLSGIITDNHVTAATVADVLGLDASVVKVHHQPALDTLPPFDTVVQYTAAFDDDEFSDAHPFKVVWPHRIDREKRPDALIKVVEALRAARLPVEVHVHGSAVLHGGDPDVRPRLRELGVVVHGPYSGGLLSLPTETYHCLLLTSESEGLPLVLVQALLLGLPVVSSAVGGVVDIITDRETGLLTAGPDDISGFVEAIRELIASRELRRTLIRTGYDFARTQHSPDAFRLRVREEFEAAWSREG